MEKGRTGGRSDQQLAYMIKKSGVSIAERTSPPPPHSFFHPSSLSILLVAGPTESEATDVMECLKAKCDGFITPMKMKGNIVATQQNFPVCVHLSMRDVSFLSPVASL